MNKNIIKICITIAFLGVVASFFLIRYNDSNNPKVSELKQGQMEKITGMVNSVYVSKGGHIFLKVADTSGEISVVIFNNSNIDEAYDIGVGDQISVFGMVSEYNGKLEIIAKKINKI
jgi:DNA polymerase II small subunit/DNA polymerase delta subunit B